jgi:hypothetical protein
MKFLSNVKKHAKRIYQQVAEEIRNIRLAQAAQGFGAFALLAIPHGLAGPAAPFSPLSFSLDLSGMVDFAETIFNALSPIVVIIGGIVLGLGLVSMVLALVMGAVRGKAR